MASDIDSNKFWETLEKNRFENCKDALLALKEQLYGKTFDEEILLDALDKLFREFVKSSIHEQRIDKLQVIPKDKVVGLLQEKERKFQDLQDQIRKKVETLSDEICGNDQLDFWNIKLALEGLAYLADFSYKFEKPLTITRKPL